MLGRRDSSTNSLLYLLFRTVKYLQVSKLNIFKTFCFEYPRMVAAVVWLLPMCKGDIVPSLQDWKSWDWVEILCLNFPKTGSNQNIKLRKVANFEKLWDFSNLCFPYVRDLKQACWATINRVKVIVCQGTRFSKILQRIETWFGWFPYDTSFYGRVFLNRHSNFI